MARKDLQQPTSLPGPDSGLKNSKRRRNRVPGLTGEASPETFPTSTEPVRSHKEIPRRQRAEHGVMAHRGQSHRRNTSAPFAIRISSKLTWCYVRVQVSRDHLRSSRKYAFLRISGWRFQLSNDRVRHIQGAIFHPQPLQVVDHGGSLRIRQYLRFVRAALGSEDAEPHFDHLRLAAPEPKKFFEIAGSTRDLRSDGAVNGDPRSSDVLQDTIVRSRFAPCIMLR